MALSLDKTISAGNLLRCPWTKYQVVPPFFSGDQGRFLPRRLFLAYSFELVDRKAFEYLYGDC